jgi:predicted enzyme related to lactoylglutathione lyase
MTAPTPTPNSVAWFEIGTTAPELTKRFYGELFGWRIEFDDSAGGVPYYNIFTGAQYPSGGMWDHGKGGQDYAMVSVLVQDVLAAVDKAKQLGATVEVEPTPQPRRPGVRPAA